LNREFAVGLNGPCKNASGHVWTLPHAYTGHSKLTQLLNTIPTIFMIIGKNPYRRGPQYCTRGKRRFAQKQGGRDTGCRSQRIHLP
jgi:hypothetical protein